MPTIKKILFPVDFSNQSLGAARYVEAFAGRFDAEVMLLHVVGNGERTLAQELLSQRKAELEAFLIDELKYFSTERVCVLGDSAEKIIEIANDWQPDLVMMPTHGLGFYRRLLLGSVTAKVLHDLECPVWTDVHAENAPILEKITVRKIVCAVDLGSHSACVLRWGAFLAGEYQAELSIVHAMPTVEAAAQAHFLDQEFIAAITAEAHQRIGALQSSVGTKGGVFIEAGEPAKATAKVADQLGADLVLIGRHGGAGIAGHLRQNAYAILRDSPCPVISV